MRHLKKLNLSQTDISTDKMHTIIQCCPELNDLNVGQCFDAPGDIIQALTENSNALQHLTTLNLDLTRISTDQMHTIIQCCPELNDLSIRCCSNAPAGMIQALQANSNALQHLKILDLNSTFTLNDQMHIIVEHCSQLKQLNVRNCYYAPVGIIQALKANPNALQNLKTLILEKANSSVSVEQTDFIQKSLPHLQIDW